MEIKKFDKFDKINENINFEIKKDSRGFEWEHFSFNELVENTNVILINFHDDSNNEDMEMKMSTKKDRKVKFNNNDFIIKGIFSNSDYPHQIGYILFNDNEPTYFIRIYEPHGFATYIKKGMITFYGHEEIVNLWLEDGDNNVIYTR